MAEVENFLDLGGDFTELWRDVRTVGGRLVWQDLRLWINTSLSFGLKVVNVRSCITRRKGAVEMTGERGPGRIQWFCEPFDLLFRSRITNRRF